MLASVLDRELIRLQCYEGLDAAQALYEWDHPKQLLAIRACEAEGRPVGELYDPEFLMERPLLRALREPCVLLIDEIDRADSEFEAFLLEFLSDFQITIPELGTIHAQTPPVVVLTSNRTRELHDALKRRCLYHWIAFPDAERERAIIEARVPGLADEAASSLVEAVTGVRRLRLIKPPGIAETIDWAQGAKVLADEGDGVAAGAAPQRRPAGQGGRGHRGRAGAPRALTVLDAFLDDWRPIPDKRMDFLRALAAEPPADIMRLYWLARVTLVTRLEDIPRFDALFGVHFLGNPDASSARRRGGRGAGAAAVQGRRAAAGRARARARASTPASTSCSTGAATTPRPRTSSRCARRCRSTSRGSARAAAGPRAAATSTCAARCARPRAPARSPRSPAATARTARGRCWS